MPFWFRDLLHNVTSGTLLALLWRRRLSDFRVDSGALVALLALQLFLTLLLGLLEHLPQPRFYQFAVPVYALGVLVFLGFSLAVGHLLRVPQPRGLNVAIVVLSTMPLLQLAGGLLPLYVKRSGDLTGQAASMIGGGIVLWLLVIVLRALHGVFGGRGRRLGSAWLLVLAALLGPQFYYAEDARFWYPAAAGDGAGKQDAYAAYRKLDAEQLLYRQPELLDTQLAKLAPQRAAVSDWYFIGVGGYAMQDVFMHETLYARALFDRQFGTENRSLVLLNNLQTQDSELLASTTNLRGTISGIGARMDRDNDVLALFMTSHGSADHQLALDFWPLPLNDLTPGRLKQYLDDAAIRWRLIIVSACYSGGFVETLKDEHTLIMTAAAADKQSFGCSNTRDFTYFGEALLRDQLAPGGNLIDAFGRAAQALAARERDEGLQPSQPQLFVGAAMAEKLNGRNQGRARTRQQISAADDAR